MKKFKKTLLSLGIILSFFSLVSCNSNSNDTNTKNNTTQTEEKESYQVITNTELRNKVNEGTVSSLLGKNISISGYVYSLDGDLAYLINNDVAFSIYFKNTNNKNLVSIGNSITIKGNVLSSEYDNFLYVDSKEIESCENIATTSITAFDSKDDLLAHKNALYSLKHVLVSYKSVNTNLNVIGIKCGNDTVGIILRDDISSINEGDYIDISFISIISSNKINNVDLGIIGYYSTNFTLSN